VTILAGPKTGPCPKGAPISPEEFKETKMSIFTPLASHLMNVELQQLFVTILKNFLKRYLQSPNGMYPFPPTSHLQNGICRWNWISVTDIPFGNFSRLATMKWDVSGMYGSIPFRNGMQMDRNASNGMSTSPFV